MKRKESPAGKKKKKRRPPKPKVEGDGRRRRSHEVDCLIKKERDGSRKAWFRLGPLAARCGGDVRPLGSSSRRHVDVSPLYLKLA